VKMLDPVKKETNDLPMVRFPKGWLIQRNQPQTKETRYWRIKLVSTYDPQASGPTPFSPRGFPMF
jgi:hypothetical protein